MDTIECILTRRSCRSFTSETVSKEDIELLLKCAMQSPTAADRQSWSFVVIQNRKVLDKIPGFQTYGGFVAGAPAGILVCGDSARNADMWAIDASIAAQTILLAAHSIGLGGCWLAVQPFPAFVTGFRDLLTLPENIHPHCFVVIGHPAEKRPVVNRFDEKKIHYDRW